VSRAIALLVLALAAAGCGATSSPVSPREQGNVRAVSRGDPGVLSAQRTAQRRWGQFARSFRSPKDFDHEVKVAFPTRAGSREHLWVHVTAIRGDRVTGTISNDPVNDIGYAYSDRVTIARARVEDWGIWRGRRLLVGGFSLVAVSRSRG
jgi:uncharacterized protein YegJ (DUF2314 family)